jgi:hypothetical protein
MNKDLEAALKEAAERTMALDTLLNDPDTSDTDVLLAQLCAISFAQMNVIVKLCVMLDVNTLRPRAGKSL